MFRVNNLNLIPHMEVVVILSGHGMAHEACVVRLANVVPDDLSARDAAEWVYHWTNDREDDSQWTHRSLSVGDIVLVSGVVLICRGDGWESVKLPARINLSAESRTSRFNENNFLLRHVSRPDLTLKYGYDWPLREYYAHVIRSGEYVYSFSNDRAHLGGLLKNYGGKGDHLTSLMLDLPFGHGEEN